jgi:nitroreductase/NAD-dependent dihydropyrimidine dehydrogenase PreA subunit
MITINKKQCSRCLSCYDVCPYYVIQTAETPDGRETYIRYPDQCRVCGHCLAVCPTGAIVHDGFSRDTMREAPKIKLPSDALKELMVSRRSIRSYQKKDVPDTSLTDLITVGTYAGTGANLQSVKFIVVINRELLRGLEKTVIDICWNAGLKFFNGAGILNNLLAKKFGPSITGWFRSYHDIFQHRRENSETEGSIFRNAPVVILAHDLTQNPLGAINCAVALRNMELLAPTLGLGTCWTGYLVTAAHKKPKAINYFLGLDTTRQIHGGLMVGYPKHVYRYTIPREKKDATTDIENVA